MLVHMQLALILLLYLTLNKIYQKLLLHNTHLIFFCKSSCKCVWLIKKVVGIIDFTHARVTKINYVAAPTNSYVYATALMRDICMLNSSHYRTLLPTEYFKFNSRDVHLKPRVSYFSIFSVKFINLNSTTRDIINSC